MSRLNSMRLIHLPKISALLLLALITLALSGCFLNDDDDDPAPVVDADPTGYYIDTGGDVQGGSVAVDDLQALVYDNRIMMLSADNELVYDGTITSISGNSFSADFTIYTAGKDPVTTTANGTITSGYSISGTLDGSGVGSGTFTLLYANTNNQAAAVVGAWRSGIAGGGGFDVVGFTIDGAGNLTRGRTAGFGWLFDACRMNGMATPVSSTRVYSVDVVLTDCDDLSVNGDYTGLTTTRDEGATDNRLVYMVSNGTYTLSGEFNPD